MPILMTTKFRSKKAISVAEGIAQPFKVVGVLKLIIYIKAGINIAPTEYNL